MKSKVVLVFDLDDTLYKEIDFLKSAFKDIASYLSNINKIPSNIILSEMNQYHESGLNVFDSILQKYKISLVSTKDLIHMYRNHKPQICLSRDRMELLIKLKKNVFKVGLITDGRSVQQRNKIDALGLSSYFDDIIISEEFGSEKPNINNFKFFVDKYGTSMRYVYVGDNTKKDFIGPNHLEWCTICLMDDGENIHKQSFDLDITNKPNYVINDLNEIETILN
ncbi:HAD family hydrolase [Confluentibacter flavum]|uniref:HAD family hydrolase n=1 Tax=Confluentibacter flavum TaxID=1909700 RepID=A0A2N3HGI9_9FLAO|nr:HAD family hydrolase [Confluentibacter flavum]PKQ44075.1 HAD family hydrolase [Confluentibacter flavum]